MACIALASCVQPEGHTSEGTAVPSGAPVDAAVQQRVKNGCVDQLEAQAAAATPAPGLLHPQKASLARVAFLGDARQIELPGGATGYELGIEFVYKLGHDDPRTGKKLCRINLVDSSVEWKSLK
ncbi:hypothetical protein V3C33_20380 [Micrococcaceae bacterium Sec5.7]